MKIGIYGGTFDPPHLGHMLAAKGAKRKLKLDKLILIPAKVPPHKALDRCSASPEERLEMTRLMAMATEPTGSVEVSDCELRREGKSYTVDTITEFAQKYPNDELWLIMGSDMFLTFQQWRNPEEICTLAHLCGFTRAPGEPLQPLEDQAAELQRLYGAKTRTMTLPKDVDVSSSDIRRLLREKEQRTISKYLWCQVYGYIILHRLYGTELDLKRLKNYQLRAASYSMMLPKRIPHVKGTELEAVQLANRWGANPQYARRAAILHDCTKYYSLEEHMTICQRYGIPLDPIEKGSEKLFHAKTGAALACHIFGEPKEVQAAIYYHTTGKGNMTTLEKVLYLADYMEPHRDFPGVEKLRALAYTDLDAAVALGCEMSIAEMEEKGRPVHPNTQAALDSLRK